MVSFVEIDNSGRTIKISLLISYIYIIIRKKYSYKSVFSHCRQEESVVNCKMDFLLLRNPWCHHPADWTLSFISDKIKVHDVLIGNDDR